MKTKTIIISMAAVALYLFSGAVALHQLSLAKAETRAALAKLETARAESVKWQARSKSAEAQSREWEQSARNMAAASQRLLDVYKPAQSVPTTSAPAQQTRAAHTSQPPASPRFQVPRWSPQPLPVVTRSVKAKAMAENGSDYAAANYEIDRQMDAYAKLLRYQQMQNAFINDILNQEMLKRGDDYTGAVYEIERQLEARAKVEAR